MTATTTATTTATEATREAPSPRLAPYMAAVSARLDGLSAERRAEVLDDLAHHLAEVDAEPDGDLADRLGTPSAFAEEYTTSAGLAPATGTDRRIALTSSWRATVDRWRADDRVAALAALAVELRPAWWLARGYLAVAALAVLGGDDTPVPFPHLFGSRVVGLVVAVAAAAWSLRLGRRQPEPGADEPAGGAAGGPRWGAIGAVVTAVGLLAFLVVGLRLTDGPHHDYSGYGYRGPDAPGYLMGPDGTPIDNIYAFDPDGRPIDQVLLYDGNGRPLELHSSYDPYGNSYGAEGIDPPVIANLYPQPESTVVYGPNGYGSTVTTIPSPPSVIVPRPSNGAGGPTSTTPTTTPTTAAPAGGSTPSTAPAADLTPTSAPEPTAG